MSLLNGKREMMARRAGAASVDLLLSAAPFIVMTPIAVGVANTVEGTVVYAMAIQLGVLFSLAMFGIVSTVQGFRRKQTVGQKLMKIARRTENEDFDRGKQAARTGVGAVLLAFVAYAPPLGLIYPAWILLDRSNRGPLDLISKTVFVPAENG